MTIIWSDRVLKIFLWLSVFANIFFAPSQQKIWWFAGIFTLAAIARYVIWNMASPEEKKVIGVEIGDGPDPAFDSKLLYQPIPAKARQK